MGSDRSTSRPTSQFYAKMAHKPSPSGSPGNAIAWSDKMWMAVALECAQQGRAQGEVPVGAVVVGRKVDWEGE